MRFIFFVSFAILTSCRALNPGLLKDKPTTVDRPEFLKVDVQVTLDEVIDKKAARLSPQPWTDFYWAFARQGIAYRFQEEWIPTTKEGKAAYTAERYHLSKFLQKLLDGLDDNGDKLAGNTIKLSPAEKIDLISSPLSAGDMKKNAGIQKDIQTLKDQEEGAGDNVRKLAGLYATLFNDGQYIESLKKHFPFVIDGWRSWTTKAQLSGYSPSGYGEDGEAWDWEGMCNGWSAGAVNELRPEHSAMIAKNNKKVIFTEGDIRALLTRMWLNSSVEKSSSTFFVGGRCGLSNDDIGFDAEKQRALDGFICEKEDSIGECLKTSGRPWLGDLKQFQKKYADKGGTLNGWVLRYKKFTFKGGETTKSAKDYYALPVKKNGDTMRVLSANNLKDQFSLNGEWDDDQKVYVQRVVLFDTDDALSDFLEDEKKVKSITAADTQMLVFSSCRNVNAATFHIALLRFLHNKESLKRGFVMDRDAKREVWDQPVVGYTSKVMKPVDAAKFKPFDALASSRAGDTKNIVYIETEVFYSEEPKDPTRSHPTFFYDGDRGETRDMDVEAYTVSETYGYTLEFDAKGLLIGGEWGIFRDLNDELIAKINAGTAPAPKKSLDLRPSDGPDFLWGYIDKPKNLPPDDISLRFSSNAGSQNQKLDLIKQIHKCSLEKASKITKIEGYKNDHGKYDFRIRTCQL